MKTTLTCTVTEAAAELKKHLTGIDEVVITNLPQTSIADGSSVVRCNNYVEELLRVTRILFPVTHLTHNKFAAIKEFRSRIDGLGLGEAKHAIEQPDKAIEHYLRTGRVYN